jgi:hypothetical protein
MIWIEPSEKDTATDTQENRLWDAADQLRANSTLKAQEYLGPNSASDTSASEQELRWQRAESNGV